MTCAIVSRLVRWLSAKALPMIGKLLGHTQVQTTARYAHLASDTVKASGSRIADSIGADILGKDIKPDAA